MGPSPVLEPVSQCINGHASEMPRAKNQRAAPEPSISNVVLGNLLIKPWYQSFYPEELIGKHTDRLYVCQWCFKYSNDPGPFLGHVKVCPSKDEPPPGNLIYSKDSYSIQEVDGGEHKLYTQNLSLFAKLFLDTKSVFYDVTTFLYYLLISTDPASGQSQVIGFFSKEKMSWDNNNLACILVFPPWQRQGLGQILMGVSYELSKREGRLGGPEKPLSELGRRGYISYWSGTIARYILSQTAKQAITVREISNETYIQSDDLIAALKDMNVLEQRKEGGTDIIINKSKVKAWATANRVKMMPPVDVKAFLLNGKEGDEE